MRKEREEYDPKRHLLFLLERYSDEIPSQVIHSPNVQRDENGIAINGHKVQANWWSGVIGDMGFFISKQTPTLGQVEIYNQFLNLVDEIRQRPKTLFDPERKSFVTQYNSTDIQQANVLIRRFLGIDT